MRTPAREVAGEAVGTFILVLFGVGSVQAAVLTGAQAGLWQVAVVGALAVALAIYTVAGVCDAHLNPAITVAMTVYRRFAPAKAAAYVAAQLVGAILAALLLHALYGGALVAFEAANGLVRGSPGSERSAMVFGEYFPDPALAKANGWPPTVVPVAVAALAEGVGTAFLTFVVFALTDERNRAKPGPGVVPVMVGLTVAAVISIVAPLTQAGLNPARDFGPRLVAYFLGWRDVAIPGPQGGFFVVYVLAPVVGAVLGAGVQRLLVDSSEGQKA